MREEEKEMENIWPKSWLTAICFIGLVPAVICDVAGSVCVHTAAIVATELVVCALVLTV